MTDTKVTTSAAKQQHPLVQLRERLEARQYELRAVLPDDVAPERFIRAIKPNSPKRSPKLRGRRARPARA